MAEFYLPIKIGQRRMHICHLNNPSVNFGFEFIIPIAGNDIELFSFSHNAKLISTNGTKFNREPTKENFKVEHSEIVHESLVVKITLGKGEGINDTPLQNSELGISIDRDSHSNFVAKATNLISVKKLNITICYKEKNKDPFEYSFSIHTPKEKEDTRIYKAAIDFGSEASQVSFKNHSGGDQPQFIRVVDTLKEFYKQHSEINNFWQGKTNETDPEKSRLFKSVFFVNKKPINGYGYADKPNKNVENTILQTLTPKKSVMTVAKANIYESLFLLPNLKLVELLADGNYLPGDIEFNSKETNPRQFKGSKGILSSDLIEDFIRMILNNLLHAILQKIKVETLSEKYLHITLLMPNVYSQKKVYTIIQNFYKDFNEIIKNDEYKNFKGIEVQAMSESDASFIGARFRSNGSIPVSDRISNGVNANYLVIDAGKGTTDFSIVKQQETFVKYDSRFRTGLPGSGQMLSYAFVEAIAEMFDGDLFELIKTENKYPDIIEFMDQVETLKKNHILFKELSNESTSSKSDTLTESNKIEKEFSNLSEVNVFIKSNFIDSKIRIPNSNIKVNQKVSELVNKIEEHIRYSGIESFHQVILAGRAFRFEPLLTAVKNKFENFIIADNKFIFQNSHSKFICIDGAFQGENIQINLNSELIGSPVILDDKYNPYSPPKKFIDKFFPKNEEKFIDETFFNNGRKLNYDLNNKIIQIGARGYSPSVGARNAAKKSILFYTGDGFTLQWNDGSESLIESNISQDFSHMVKDTLFPFAEISFSSSTGSDNSSTPIKLKLKQKAKSKAAEETKPTETKKQDSQKKSDSDDVDLS